MLKKVEINLEKVIEKRNGEELDKEDCINLDIDFQLDEFEELEKL